MSPEATTGSRRIVLIGLAAPAPGSEMAICLVDEAGNRIDRAPVNDDGSCRLSEEALASAHGVIVELDNVLVEADEFRQLIDSEDPVCMTALLAAGVRYPGVPRTQDDHGGFPLPGGGGGPSRSDLPGK